MRRVELKRRPVDLKALIKRTALESDTEEVITEPCILESNGEFIAAYGHFAERYDEVLWAVQSLSYDQGKRTLGLKSTSRIFGYSPRLTIRRDYCSATRMAMEMPLQHEVICGMGVLLERLYAELVPDKFAYHKEQVKRVKEDWRISGTVFTSGIVNKTNQLKYHHDSGNFKGVLSCMAVFTKDIQGGYLSLPEFGVRILLRDRSYFIFDGQGVLHGVTPMKTLRSTGYRYSIVYYSLEQMKNCQTCREELARIRVVKREREKRRLQYK